MRYATRILGLALFGSWMIGANLTYAGDVGAQAGLPVREGASMTVAAARTSGWPGELIPVHVYLSNVDNLAAYQVILTVSGGTTGSLLLEDLTIDRSRTDYVFGTDEIVEMIDNNGGRIGAARFSGETGVGKSLYAATFHFRASPDAAGSFTVNVEIGSESLLANVVAQRISFRAGEAATISIKTPKRAPTQRGSRRTRATLHRGDLQRP
ncbi:MAG: hypothetical protein JSU63_06220 [Phycisphaerales bacterium]|nr:MAG: hypothetical protein JSU63_06220 [Phycisphaerales bacterium]